MLIWLTGLIGLNTWAPEYSGKQMVRGDLRIFSSKRSFLLRKRMMEVSPNHLLLQIESNNFKLSCIRFWKSKFGLLERAKKNIVWFYILLWKLACYVDFFCKKNCFLFNRKDWFIFVKGLFPPKCNFSCSSCKFNFVMGLNTFALIECRSTLTF